MSIVSDKLKREKLKELNDRVDSLFKTRGELVRYRNTWIDHPIKYYFRNWSQRFQDNEKFLDHIDSKLHLLYLEMQKYE